jgi:ATP-dependent DNA ligase
MKLIETLPLLVCENKLGKNKVWSAQIFVDDHNVAWSMIQFGVQDGKLQEASREYKVGKNIGKKNETTPLQQCTQETKRKWQDKMEKEGYVVLEDKPPVKQLENMSLHKEPEVKAVVTTAKTTPTVYYPMLAQTYDPTTTKKKKNDIVYPCYVQPKLDGLRCVAYMHEDQIKFQSRTGTFFTTMSHVGDQLATIFEKYPKLVFDGELYTTDIPFEELAGLIKKKKISKDDSSRLQKIQYHIYDVIDLDKTFEERLKVLHTPHLFGVVDSTIQLVETSVVRSQSEFKDRFQEYVARGYEGIMLRNTKGKYVLNYRSHDLQKYKEFLESEYVITGYKEGEGRDKGTVIWVCRTKDDKEFCVRPRGTLESRAILFQNGKKYVGKLLTVVYQELSEMNVPRFPVGKAIRDGY